MQFEPMEWTVQLAEQLSDQVMVTDPKGTILYLNPAAHAHLPPEHVQSVLGGTIFSRAEAAGVDVDTIDRILKAALEDVCSETITVTRGPWQGAQFMTAASPFRYGRQVCGVVWTTRTVLTQSAIDDRQAFATVAYRLMATYQHEVRNPLQTIQAALTVLRATDPGARHGRLLDIAERNLVAISDVLSDHSLASAQPTQTSAVLLSRLASHAIADAQLRPTTRQLSFAHHVPAAEVPVQCDGLGLARAFANLFRNTAQARPNAQVDIAYSQARDGVTCVVSDDGPGFPVDILTRMFTPRDIAAHLGLMLVAAAVEGSGGRIALRNTRGGGAEVEVTLPLACPGAHAPDGLLSTGASARTNLA